MYPLLRGLYNKLRKARHVDDITNFRTFQITEFGKPSTNLFLIGLA